jgi:methionyl-tRNA formyltransferase
MYNKYMQIIFFGTSYFVVPILKSLAEQFQVIAVVTAPDKKVGRKQILTPSPVKESAIDLQKSGKDIKIFTPEKLNENFLNEVRILNPDLFVVASYGKILPAKLLQIPKNGAINIHPSVLPKYRGPSPIQEAILKGDEKTGISIIQMDEKMDHGPILMQKEEAIEEIDTFKSLSERLFTHSTNLLVHVIDNYHKIKAKVQDDKKATYTKIITKEDGFIDINKFQISNFKFQIDRAIRAYYPWPTVWTKAIISDQKSVIIKLLPEGKILVEGKKPMSFEDFINGYPSGRSLLEKLSLI